MDDRRFDGLTKAFASGSGRRALLKALLGSSGAAIARLALPGHSTDAARRSTPTPHPSNVPAIKPGTELPVPAHPGFPAVPTVAIPRAML